MGGLRPRAAFGLCRFAAFAIKERIYGNRIVLFAPLYIANYCVNNCRYCAFRQGNKALEVGGGRDGGTGRGTGRGWGCVDEGRDGLKQGHMLRSSRCTDRRSLI